MAKLSSMTNFCLVLDIDECLLHTMDTNSLSLYNEILTNPQHIDLRRRLFILRLYDVNTTQGRGVVDTYWGIFRPGLVMFLQFAFSYFRMVTIWSAGQKYYVESIIQPIFRDTHPPHLVMTYNDIEYLSSGDYHKPLQKMLDLSKGVMTWENTLFLDDKYSNFVSCPGNGVHIPKYQPSSHISSLKADDIALFQFKEWLLLPETMAATDVRTLDKSKIFTTPLSSIQTPNVQNSTHNTSIFQRFRSAFTISENFWDNNLISVV